MPLRADTSIAAVVRRCLAALLVVALAAAPASAEPQWATDLREKAEGWKRDLRAALDRLQTAADQAKDRLAADAKRRLDELLAMLGAQADAIEELLAERGAALEALAAARAEQALQIARALERELAELAAGTRRQLTVDLSRLATGARAAVESALRDAGASLRGARLIDGRLVAQVTDEAKASARRWAWALVGAGGVAVIAVGLGLVWPRRRGRDRAARRWLVTAAGLGVIASGGALAWVGATRSVPDDRAAPAVLAIARCDALDRARPSDRAARARLVRDLARCQLAAIDDASAAVITAALARALAPSPAGGPP